jgi:hypothetical protein
LPTRTSVKGHPRRERLHAMRPLYTSGVPISNGPQLGWRGSRAMLKDLSKTLA